MDNNTFVKIQIHACFRIAMMVKHTIIYIFLHKNSINILEFRDEITTKILQLSVETE